MWVSDRQRVRKVIVRQFLNSKQYIFTKIANYSLAWLQEKLKMARVVGYPPLLFIDIGNICSLKCPLCPTGKNAKGRDRGFMSFVNFKEVIDEFAPYLAVADLYNWGEPFLNKDIFRMIDYAHRKGIVVRLSSNLNYLDGNMTEQLVQSKCDILIISLDGTSQGSCSKYQIGTDFSKVIRNIQLIRGARGEGKYPLLYWRFLVNKYNEPEIMQAIEMSKSLVDVLEIGDMMCDTTDMLFMDDSTQFENIKEWLPADERYSMFDYRRRQKKHTGSNLCSSLYRQSVINWNGSVSPCCALWYESMDFGNIYRGGFANIWNNENYRSARNLVFSGRSDGVETICNICKANNAIM
jgi:radical SAM protein with 4Fe4S-binding SPASM domain